MQTSSSLFSERAYDKLKFVAQVLLPALASLVFGFAELWELPYGLKLVGTITLIDTFLGVLLGLSNAQYKKGVVQGDMIVNAEAGTGNIQFDQSNLYGKHALKLNIRQAPPSS